MVPTKFTLNLGATINLVLYDRMAKELNRQKMLENRKNFLSI